MEKQLYNFIVNKKISNYNYDYIRLYIIDIYLFKIFIFKF